MLTEDEMIAQKAILKCWNEASDELYKLRVSVARLAQAMKLGHFIPKIRSEMTGDEMDINMQEASYEVLYMAAGTDRGWNALVGEMVGAINAINDR